LAARREKYHRAKGQVSARSGHLAADRGARTCPS
jgi:hypothetical protein